MMSQNKQQQPISAAGEISAIVVDKSQRDKPDSEDDGVSVDIDELKEQLGIDKIMASINAIAKQLNQNGVAEYPGSGAPETQSDVSIATAFDPTAPIDMRQHVPELSVIFYLAILWTKYFYYEILATNLDFVWTFVPN